MGPRASQDLRSPSPIMAPVFNRLFKQLDPRRRPYGHFHKTESPDDIIPFEWPNNDKNGHVMFQEPSSEIEAV